MIEYTEIWPVAKVTEMDDTTTMKVLEKIDASTIEGSDEWFVGE